jgi:hypothetical protein
MPQPDFDTLVTRISILETRQRRLLWLISGACVLAAFLAFVGPPFASGRQQDKLRVLDANAFRVLGEDGKIKAMFAISEEGAALYFLDDRGKRRMTLEGTPKGGSIVFLDDRGTTRALLDCKDKEGVLVLRTEGPGGMHLTNDGIRLIDKTGKARGSLVQSKEGKALLGIMDEHGDVTFSGQ